MELRRKNIEYRIFSNMIGDEKIWMVGYVKDKSQPVHGGNVEYLDGIYTSREEAKKALAEANKTA